MTNESMASDGADEKSQGEDSSTHDEDAGKGLPVKGKRLILLIVGIVVSLLLLGGGFFYYTHSKKKAAETAKAEAVEKAKETTPVVPKSIFVPLEEFLVNLSTNSSEPSFLKMVVELEVASLQADASIKTNMPRIRDTFLTYLRELRAEDLQGSAGIFRLREELLLRVNKILYPVEVKDILFKDIIVQ